MLAVLKQSCSMQRVNKPFGGNACSCRAIKFQSQLGRGSSFWSLFYLSPAAFCCTTKDNNMLDKTALLAAVTILGVLEQAYFALQVISARRKYKVSPPCVTGPPEFERVFRAQINCSEYFPIFVSVLWVAGVFFHQGAAAACGLLYLYSRYQYFRGYALAAHARLGPMHFSARVLWILIGMAIVGLLIHFLSLRPLILREDLLSKLHRFQG
ncbi:leukotriene C4 synthase [Alligator sinensis]|uniref:Leukotriene C4 synthase n=1 Tax=Alligator sinensis TaxID=38654 RepID=A0A1U7S015_ALLSI|nr:leukotriene C4 synthase [Alligator sinensis]